MHQEFFKKQQFFFTFLWNNRTQIIRIVNTYKVSAVLPTSYIDILLLLSILQLGFCMSALVYFSSLALRAVSFFFLITSVCCIVPIFVLFPYFKLIPAISLARRLIFSPSLLPPSLSHFCLGEWVSWAASRFFSTTSFSPDCPSLLFLFLIPLITTEPTRTQSRKLHHK